MSANTRCSNCISKEEEVELLKGELEELDSENQQLHDTISQLKVEESTNAQKLTSAQQVIAHKTQEIQQLNDTIKELNVQVKDQSKRKDMTSNANVVSSEGNAKDFEKIQFERDEFRRKTEKLETKLAELKATMAKEALANENAKQALENVNNDTKLKRDEFYKVLKENEVIRMEMNELQEALKKVSEIAIDYENTIKVQQGHENELKEAIHEQTIEITQLHVKLDQMGHEKKVLEAKLIEMDERESDVDTLVREFKLKHEMEKASLVSQLEEAKRLVSSSSSSSLKNSNKNNHHIDLSNEELEKQIAMLEELRIEDKATIAELEHHLRQREEDLKTVMEQVDVDSIVKKAVDQAIQKEKKSTIDVMQELQRLKKRVKEQSDMMKEMEAHTSEIEHQLLEAQSWNAKYEAKAGLEDVIKEQKKLRSLLEKQRKENQNLRIELNQRIEVCGKLSASFDRLKNETGKPEDFEYDEFVIEEQMKGEIAELKAILKQTEYQLEQLELERVDMLKQLREKAKLVGKKLFQNEGLSMEQVEHVQEFIRRLKEEGNDVALRLAWKKKSIAAINEAGDEPLSQDEEKQKLKNEITWLRQELASYTQNKKDSLSADYPTEKNTHFTRAVNEEVAKATQKLETQIQQMLASEKSGQNLIRTNQDSYEDDKFLMVNPEGDASMAPPIGSDISSHRLIKSGSSSQGDLINKNNQLDQKTPRGEPVSAEYIAQVVTSALEKRLGTSNGINNMPLSPDRMQSRMTIASEEEVMSSLALHDELNICLNDLVVSKAREEELVQQLSIYEKELDQVMKQHTVLYQHFIHNQKHHHAMKAKFQKNVEELKAQQNVLQTKCVRYEQTLKSTDQLKEISTITRQLAEAEVKCSQLQRSNTLLIQKCTNQTRLLDIMQQDTLEIEKTLKNRLFFLEIWKKGAEERLSQMEDSLKVSVPKEELKATREEANMLLKKHSCLWEAHAQLQMKFVASLSQDVSESQMQRLVHENKLLKSQLDQFGMSGTTNKKRTGQDTSIESVFQGRIDQLEDELKAKVLRIQELETINFTKLGETIVVQSNCKEKQSSDVVLQENSILKSRINEVEQLYHSLMREYEKARETATLAASQSNVLVKRISQMENGMKEAGQSLKKQMENASESDQDALIGKLQQQLSTLQSEYQQFAARYEKALDQLRVCQLESKQYELQMESKANELISLKEHSRENILALETALEGLRKQDFMARTAKWESFSKRLAMMEEEITAERLKRKQLEMELDEKQHQMSSLSSFSLISTGQSDIGRLKSRIEVLEARERVLLSQLEALSSLSSSSLTDSATKDEFDEAKRQNEELITQLKNAQTRIAELLRNQNVLENSKRELQRQKESLELMLTEVKHAPISTEIIEPTAAPIQAQAQALRQETPNNAANGGSNSPLMRKKVGFYEQDQMQLQQAAQATIASLKLLVQEKNTLLDEYKRKIEEMRLRQSTTSGEEREEQTQLHKRIYEENQKNINQLKDSLLKIKQLEESGSNNSKAIRAAREMHDSLLNELKQANIEIETLKQQIQEKNMQLQVARNQRDTAEARAGEALEEIVLLKENEKAQVQVQKESKQHEHVLKQQLVTLKGEMTAKDKKMHLLRDAIIKLKEEFMKAEERHAVEMVQKQQQQTQKRQGKEKQLEEDKKQLAAQVELLQEKLKLSVKSRSFGSGAISGEEKKIERKLTKKNSEQAHQLADVDVAELKSVNVALKAEVERLKRVVKEKILEESAKEELEKKMRVLEAQNLALREASSSQKSTGHGEDNQQLEEGDSARTGRKTWEQEKKLERRVEMLRARLEEKKKELESTHSQLEHLRENYAKLQQSTKHAKESEKPEIESQKSKKAKYTEAAAHEMEQKIVQLQEALVSERSKWEAQHQSRVEAYEVQVERLRAKLQKFAGKNSKHSNDSLVEEETRFLALKDEEDEMGILAQQLYTAENELVKKDTQVMELQFELENLKMELQQHRRTGAGAAGTNSGQKRSSPTSSNSRINMNRQRVELEEVIENMKRVIEKLRSENERLKKHAASTSKSSEAVRILKETRKENSRMLEEVEQLRSEMSKLKEENVELHRKFRTLTNKYKELKRLSPEKGSGGNSLSKSPKELDQDGRKREMDMEMLHNLQLNEKAQRIKRLELQLQEEKQSHLRDVERLQEQLERRKRQAAGMAWEEKSSSEHRGESQKAAKHIEELEDQIDELKKENQKLVKELSAFDLEFFEEIEDLKYKYSEAIREKQILEKMMQRS